MTIKKSVCKLVLPAIAATIFASATAHANDAPQVAINGVKNGNLIFQGPVQVSGVTGDADGISVIYGTIQNANTQLFFSPDGKFVKDPTRLPYQFAKNVTKTTWSTNAYRLPAGNYIYRMRVEDSKELRTDIIEVPLQVRGAGAADRSVAVAKPAAQQQTQQATQPAAQPAAKPAGTMASNGMAYCSNAGMDADGDGYGWENEKSCIVAGSKADKHPNCASSDSDPDGDGWGWENEKSCIVVTHCKSTGSDPDGDGWGWENDKSCVVVKTSGRYPACASANSDPDGDGYGWENNATCLVAK